MAPFSLQNIASYPGSALCFPGVNGFKLRHFITSVSLGAQTECVPFISTSNVLDDNPSFEDQPPLKCWTELNVKSTID